MLDFDGTLCATHEAILFCINKTFSTLGKPIPNYNFTEKTIRAGLGMENTLKTLLPETPDSEIQKLLNTYETIYLQEGEQKSNAFANAGMVLAKLQIAGFILIVVSNKAVAAINAALERFNLKRYITMVIGDTKTLRKKPDPMAYTDFIQPKFKTIPPNKILMVGDTTADLLFAQAIGADSCWAAYGYGEPESCRALKPKYIINHLTDILAILF